MVDQADNIYRQLQETVAGALTVDGIDASPQVEPTSSKIGNDALNSDGIYAVVGYPTIVIGENRQAQVDLPVQVIVNPEIAEDDGFDLALKIAGALDQRQLDLEWWTELRIEAIDPTGTEDGLVVFTVRVQTRTVQTVDNAI